MPKQTRDENTAPNTHDDDPRPTKTSKATSPCKYCNKKFTTRGITRHQNSCKKKQGHDETTAKKLFQFPIQSNAVFEYFLKFMSNQTLIKLQVATGGHYLGCEPELAKYCCSCENDNPIILLGLCRECESELPGYLPRTTKEVARNNYGVREKDFCNLQGEVRKHFMLFDRIMLENHMIATCGSKLAWVRHLAKKDQRTKKLRATLRRKDIEAEAFVEQLAPGFADYIRAINFMRTDKNELERCSQRFVVLTAELRERGLELRTDSRLCQVFITTGDGNAWSIVDTMDEMNFLFTHTDYAERCDRNVKNMRNKERNENFYGKRMRYSSQAYREELQDCRDEAKAEIREEYLTNSRGLTLPRKWENMRSQMTRS
ncbi:hypothetical protein PC128_g16447 [Phytophthora cactorum]|nr:hypothetical protein PC128_g16447 [Phytophthora cactorum]